MRRHSMKGESSMKAEYDFSQGIKNPYVRTAKKQITIKVNTTVIDYFKNMAIVKGIPYQTLINMYLTDCVLHKRELQTSW